MLHLLDIYPHSCEVSDAYDWYNWWYDGGFEDIEDCYAKWLEPFQILHYAAELSQAFF